jgi:uncharacterized protein (TIGR00725 family)
MPRKFVLGIIGGASATAVKDAKELGELAAQQDWVVLTGGRDSGVMAAALKGAKSENGLTVGIIPNSDSSIAPDVDIAIVTDMNNARNNVVGLSSDALVACGVDGPGTASEVSLALKNKRDVILLNASPQAIAFFRTIQNRDAGKVIDVYSAQAAIDEVLSRKPH